MPPSLSFAEALKAAAAVEEAGMAFYRAAAERAWNPAAAEVFRGLLAYEEKHRDYFAAFQKRASAGSALPASERDAETARDLAGLARDGVFPLKGGVPAFFNGSETPAQAVKAAIALEKDSIIFYLGLEKAMANREEALKVREIIDEEMRHIAVLTALLKQLN